MIGLNQSCFGGFSGGFWTMIEQHVVRILGLKTNNVLFTKKNIKISKCQFLICCLNFWNLLIKPRIILIFYNLFNFTFEILQLNSWISTCFTKWLLVLSFFNSVSNWSFKLLIYLISPLIKLNYYNLRLYLIILDHKIIKLRMKLKGIK